jgi:transcriptional regulator of NAD metabolism
VYISSKYENLLGYKDGYLCGDIKKFLNIMHPEDRERIVNHNIMSLKEKELSYLQYIQV